VLFSNSIDLVVNLEKSEGRTVTDTDVLLWMARAFGEDRATAAALAKVAQRTTIIFERHREQEREQQKEIERERQPATRAPEPAHMLEREHPTDRDEHVHSRKASS
jgi:hypothetical protein